ncbi:MAG: NPCBM/NEW2 domain-containing protein [Planctomycetes bacterium]|nr:NPCBM/NEW2 domain-containing protein [Planctomycetota bacterium]
MRSIRGSGFVAATVSHVTRLRGAALLAIAIVPAAFAAAGVAAAPDESPFLLPEPAPGAPPLAVTTFATAPQLHNPTSLDVDCDGRVWVTEAVNYRGIPARDQNALRRPNGDRVTILIDTDGDGVADASKLFVEDPELVAPLGIAVLGRPGGPREVYVSCSPNVFKYVDVDGDDRHDRRETFLTGFGGKDHDHGVHALVQGPDGALWFNAGNEGPHRVRDAAGFELRASSFTSGDAGGPGSDGRQWIGGVSLKIGRDGRGLELLAHNFRNSYELAVDAFGEVWQNDNDDDGNQGCRLTWVLPGSNQGYASADGKRSWQADRRPGQSTLTAHWHQDDPGVAPFSAATGAGGPTGILRYEASAPAGSLGGALGSEFDGALFSCDAGRSLVFVAQPIARGAGFALEPKPFLQSRAGTKQASWFRPSDVCVDVDGGLLVADWFDPGVGGHGMGDRQGGGRIVRIAPEGARRLVTRPDLATRAGAIAALDSPVLHVRAAAFDALRELLAGQDEALQELARDVERRGATPAAARRLWLLANAGASGERLAWRFVAPSGNEALTLVALRALWPTAIAPRLASGDAAIVPLLGEVAQVAGPALRRELAVRLRTAPLSAKVQLLIPLASRLDPTDRFEVEAFGLFAEGHEAELWPLLMGALGDTPTQWSARFEAIAWRLHPAAALDAFRARVFASELDLAARRRSLDALAFVPDARASEVLFELLRGDALQSGGDALRPQAAAWLQQRGGLVLERGEALWRSGRFVVEPAATAGAPATTTVTLATGEKLPAKSVSIDLSIDGAELLWLVVSDGGDGHSHDWADWLEPTLHGAPRADGTCETLSLRELTPLLATVGWGSLGVDRSAGGTSLQVAGQMHPVGFGVHAPSELAFLLPPGRFVRFTASAGPDDGGLQQPGARTSLEFSVHASRPAGTPSSGALDPARAAERSALAARAALLADRATPREQRLELARALSLEPAAGLLLIELAARGDLDDELRQAAAPGLLRHPELSVRALASESFPRWNDDGVALPSVAALLALKGDAARGRALFTSDRAGCAKCHRLASAAGGGDAAAGGDVGPALTAIGTKYDRAALLDALLQPSAAIAFGFEPWIVQTTSGELLSGFLLSDGDPLLLKEASGARRTLRAAEVAKKRRSTKSLMPDNVATGLAPQELADLVELLANARG